MLNNENNLIDVQSNDVSVSRQSSIDTFSVTFTYLVMISTLLHNFLSMCLLNTCSMLLVNCFIYVRNKQQPTLTNIYSFLFHHMSYFRYANNIFHSIPVIAPAKDDDDIQLYKQLHFLMWCVVILRFKCR